MEAKSFLQFLILSSIGKRTKQIMCYCPIDARFFYPFKRQAAGIPKDLIKLNMSCNLVSQRCRKFPGHASNGRIQTGQLLVIRFIHFPIDHKIRNQFVIRFLILVVTTDLEKKVV